MNSIILPKSRYTSRRNTETITTSRGVTLGKKRDREWFSFSLLTSVAEGDYHWLRQWMRWKKC